MIRFEHRAVPIVLSAVLIDTIGFGIILPVLPELIVHLSALPLPEAARIGGYMLVAFAVAQFVAGPIVGSLSDWKGRRIVMLLSMAAFSLNYGLMAFAPTLAWLFAGRIVSGLTGALYGPANAVLADVTPPEKRGPVFGLMGAAFGLGFILGPALGGLLAVFGPRAPFLAAAGLALVNAVWIALMLPETLSPERRRRFEWRRANALGAFAPLRSVGGAWPLVAAFFVWQLAFMVYPATWAFWAEIRLDWNPAMIGASLAFSGVVMIVVQLALAKPVMSSIGEARTALLGTACGTVAFALHMFASQTWMVYALAVAGALQFLVTPSLNALLSRSVDASNQGALQGGMASIGSLASIIGPIALSQALAFGAERGFASANFLLAALLAVGTLGILYLGVVKRNPSAAPLAGAGAGPHVPTD